MEKKYYHYTPHERLEQIIESGQINLATASVGHSKEKACAWVSTNELWERTASKLIVSPDGNYRMLSFREQHELIGCARIQVEPRGLFSWKTLIKLANMNKQIAKNMELTGMECGARVSQWFGSLRPIPIDNWICAEVFDGEKWVEYDRFEEVEQLNAA